ncbi:hypothetical protein [Herbaspirillum rubrisubalbicans]|uniref:hypothetical protein n=1 Tax=Herbaspirillum rubrisubalbicans TaxID=80842 RepID=UPI0012FDD3AF|nr:hypothetical protein [Herbaspirillum rubrisubalbicans]
MKEYPALMNGPMVRVAAQHTSKKAKTRAEKLGGEIKKRNNNPSPSSPFMAADVLQQNSNMHPLIRMLAAQAVKNWLSGNQPNTATSTTHNGNEGNDLRTV